MWKSCRVLNFDTVEAAMTFPIPLIICDSPNTSTTPAHVRTDSLPKAKRPKAKSTHFARSHSCASLNFCSKALASVSQVRLRSQNLRLRGEVTSRMDPSKPILHFTGWCRSTHYVPLDGRTRTWHPSSWRTAYLLPCLPAKQPFVR